MESRMNFVPCGYIALNNQGIIKEINQTFLTMTGYEKEELLEHYLESYLPIASKIMFHSLFLPQIQLNGCIEELYLLLKDKRGEEIPVLLMGSRGEDNQNDLIDCVLIRMKKRDEYEKELQSIKKKLEDAYILETNLHKLFETTLISINEGIIVTDHEGKITIMNAMAEEYTGWSKEAAIGRSFYDVFYSIDIQTKERQLDIVNKILKEEGKNDIFNEVILVSKTGGERFISGTVATMKSKEEKILGVVSSFRDITKEYLQERELRRIAGKDELTGLYNRHYLNSYLEIELNKAEQENASISMAILDLDHFKLVNDTWGHPIGDEQLKHTAKTVLNVIRKSDMMIRFGGEEFIIIMPQTDVNASQIVLEKVRAAIENNPLPITGRQTVSIGTAEHRKAELFTDWYKRVDEALYRAKEEGRNRIVASCQ